MPKTATSSDFESYNFTTQSSFYAEIYTKPWENYLETLLFGVDVNGPEAAISISIQRIGWTTFLRKRELGLTRRGGKKVWSFLCCFTFYYLWVYCGDFFVFLIHVTRERNRVLDRG